MYILLYSVIIYKFILSGHWVLPNPMASHHFHPKKMPWATLFFNPWPVPRRRPTWNFTKLEL